MFFKDLNLSSTLFGIMLTAPSDIIPIILAGDPDTMENGGKTMSAGTVVPASILTKSFNMHLRKCILCKCNLRKHNLLQSDQIRSDQIETRYSA